MLTVKYTVPKELESLFLGKSPELVITEALCASKEMKQDLTVIRNLCLDMLFEPGRVAAVPQAVEVQPASRPAPVSIPQLMPMVNDVNDDMDDDDFLSAMVK